MARAWFFLVLLVQVPVEHEGLCFLPSLKLPLPLLEPPEVPPSLVRVCDAAYPNHE